LQQQNEAALAEARSQVEERAKDVERQSGLALAAYELRLALDRGTEIVPTAELVQQHAGDDASLTSIAEQLKSLGDSQVPTASALATSLDDVRAGVITAGGPGAVQTGWLADARRNLGQLVDVQPSEGGGPAPIVEAIDTARAGLASGDLAAAKAAIEPFSEVPAAKDWLARLEQRKTVADAAAALGDYVETSIATP
jgi:hypothetical protein